MLVKSQCIWWMFLILASHQEIKFVRCKFFSYGYLFLLWDELICVFYLFSFTRPWQVGIIWPTILRTWCPEKWLNTQEIALVYQNRVANASKIPGSNLDFMSWFSQLSAISALQNFLAFNWAHGSQFPFESIVKILDFRNIAPIIVEKYMPYQLEYKDLFLL